MEQMPEQLNVYISTGINDNELSKGYVLVDPEDVKNVQLADRLIEKVLKNIDNALMRDAFLISLNANYPNILSKYFKWFKSYLDLSRFDENNIVQIDVYENIYTDKLSHKQMYMLKDTELIDQNNKLKKLVFELHVNRENYDACEEILHTMTDCKSIIELYYPELEKEIENVLELESRKTSL